MTSPLRNPQQLGVAVRSRRRKLNLTQADLAKQVRSYQKTISKIESGEPGVKLQTIFDVLRALEMELVIQPRSKGSLSDIEDMF